MDEPMTLAEVLKRSYEQLSPAEKRVSRALLADYPVAGLEPVNRLAERANVSAPTVLRLLSKLDIGSYPDMQKLLHGEIAARTSSPATMYARSTTAASSNGVVERSQQVMNQGLDATFSGLAIEDFEAIVALLSNAKRRVWTTGGRFSILLAKYLSMHLRHLRPNINHVEMSQQDRAFALLDIGPKDVVFAFDYRRYQESTVAFVRQAKAQKASTVLITDPWLSPAARHSDYLLTNAVVAASPFDSMTPGFALVETLIASLVDALGTDPVERVRRYDDVEELLHDKNIDGIAAVDE
ncbi:MurR/RpiR family transcriptional regulator [Leucobacter salsicius]|uniref:MurR/RpiR family transcriptional regulator n=1 Tax=Leucobacter salsicius TaxID=664638 RepID=UPI0009FE42BD|nr:MurR/RpiR family transcriptional regulator [Leucobacter salsicius]